MARSAPSAPVKTATDSFSQPDGTPSFRQPTHIRAILRRHRPFMLAAALGLSLLFAEEAWAVAQFWPHRAGGEQWLLGLASTLVAFAGNALAFILPISLVAPEKFPRPVGAFALAAGLGMVLSAVSHAVAYFLLLHLAGYELEAAYTLLKDIYVYTLVAVGLFHALLYYVRHMHWLYDEFGAADSPLKPIAASGGIALMIFVVTITFLPLDLQSINAAPLAQRGLVGLHVYARDLYLLTLAIGAYAWHLRWIADH